MAYSTFQYWAKKYRAGHSSHDNVDTAPGFIPVKVQPEPQDNRVHNPGQLHFLMPNGVQVLCSETVQPHILQTLLNP